MIFSQSNAKYFLKKTESFIGKVLAETTGLGR